MIRNIVQVLHGLHRRLRTETFMMSRSPPKARLLQIIVLLELVPGLIQRTENCSANHSLFHGGILRDLNKGVSNISRLESLIWNEPCQGAPYQ